MANHISTRVSRTPLEAQPVIASSETLNARVEDYNLTRAPGCCVLKEVAALRTADLPAFPHIRGRTSGQPPHLIAGMKSRVVVSGTPASSRNNST